MRYEVSFQDNLLLGSTDSTVGPVLQAWNDDGCRRHWVADWKTSDRFLISRLILYPAP